MSVAEVETRVRAAIAALEDAGFIRRGQNVPKIFADSILAKNATEALIGSTGLRVLTTVQKLLP